MNASADQLLGRGGCARSLRSRAPKSRTSWRSDLWLLIWRVQPGRWINRAQKCLSAKHRFSIMP
jgi:hypothetical protein